MKFGKFEIYGGVFILIAIVVGMYILLHFAFEEDKLQQQTKQLEIQREIVLIEKGSCTNEQ